MLVAILEKPVPQALANAERLQLALDKQLDHIVMLRTICANVRQLFLPAVEHLIHVLGVFASVAHLMPVVSQERLVCQALVNVVQRQLVPDKQLDHIVMLPITYVNVQLRLQLVVELQTHAQVVFANAVHLMLAAYLGKPVVRDLVSVALQLVARG